MHPDHDPPKQAVTAFVDRLTEALAERPDPAGAATLQLPERLPDDGVGEGAALDLMGSILLDGATQLHHPGFFGHMDPPTPWITWVTSLWAAALNQNLLHDDTAPAARPLERQVVDWLTPHFGMTGGHVVPGSTLANLTALWAARDIAGVRRVVSSTKAHLSIQKSARILGLDFAEVAAGADHRIDGGALGDLSDAALVLTAGTTATGAVDDMSAGADAAWRHVDAAWAGPLRLTDRHARLLDGVETADSVAFSAHKWCYQPKESALVMFADTDAAHAALAFGSGYLAHPNVGVLGSHGAAPAAALAVTLLAWGRRGLASRIEADMANAEELAGLIDATPRLELWGRPTTGIVVWRPQAEDAASVRARMQGVYVSLTEVDGEQWFRSVAANPSADPRRVVAAALDVAR